MAKLEGDVNRALMLDGNSVAGLLGGIFGAEVTGCRCQCAHCDRVDAVGTLLAFTRAPGVVLRCSGCEQVMMRLVEAADALYLEMRGVASLRLEKH
jgi:Family of unknown function (DUF6510)